MVAASALFASVPWTQTSSPYWMTANGLRQRMKSGETVWVAPREHPITVRDAHYYWFMAVPVTTTIPTVDPARLRGANRFPICAAAAGEDRTVRFLSELQATGMPAELRCLQQLLSDGRVQPLPRARLYEVQRSTRTRMRPSPHTQRGGFSGHGVYDRR